MWKKTLDSRLMKTANSMSSFIDSSYSCTGEGERGRERGKEREGDRDAEEKDEGRERKEVRERRGRRRKWWRRGNGQNQGSRERGETISPFNEQNFPALL